MRNTTGICAGSLAMVLSIAGVSTATQPLLNAPPMNAATEAIEKAAMVTDAAERLEALRSALRKGLLDSEPSVADGVFRYLSYNIRWLDLGPFEDIVTEYGRLDPLHYRATWLLDQAELLRTPKEGRLRIYSAAIVEGTTTLRHGRPLPRQSAMLLAADDGLAELKPLVERYYPDEPAEVRQTMPLPELLTRLELGAGAADREDANRLASERLAAMKDLEFRDRMDTDAAFRKVVEEISSYVCIPDPYLVRRNPGCASIKGVVKRQTELEAKAAQLKSLGGSAATRPPASVAEQAETWLGKMQESSAGELRPKQIQ